MCAVGGGGGDGRSTARERQHLFRGREEEGKKKQSMVFFLTFRKREFERASKQRRRPFASFFAYFPFSSLAVMRSLAMLSVSSSVATTAAAASASRHRALAPAQTRRPVAAAFAVAAAAAAAKAERRGVVSPAAASRRSVRVSVSARVNCVLLQCSAAKRRGQKACAIPTSGKPEATQRKRHRWPKTFRKKTHHSFALFSSPLFPPIRAFSRLPATRTNPTWTRE